jgi:arginine metabolism regulation protein II
MFKVSAASVFGQFGSPGVAAYCASKAAVIGLTRTAAKENQHIRINAVSPGKLISSSYPSYMTKTVQRIA